MLSLIHLLGFTARAHQCASPVSFSTHIITTLADYARFVFAIDVDGDGDVDVLSASSNDDTVAWYENDCHTHAPTSAPTPRPTVQCASVAFSERVITTLADYASSVFAIDVDADRTSTLPSPSTSIAKTE